MSRENVLFGGMTGREKTSDKEPCICVGTATAHMANGRIGIYTCGSSQLQNIVGKNRNEVKRQPMVFVLVKTNQPKNIYQIPSNFYSSLSLLVSTSYPMERLMPDTTEWLPGDPGTVPHKSPK